MAQRTCQLKFFRICESHSGGKAKGYIYNENCQCRKLAMSKRIQLGAINISASPHPPGIYENLFRAAAGRHINLSGSDMAKISKPTQRKNFPGILFGRILVWTPIDRRGKWLNTKTDAELTAEEKRGLALPDAAEPNFRTFYYGFRLRDHRLILEFRNSDGHGFGAARAESFFLTLFSPKTLGSKFPNVSVTVIPEDGTVERILAMPHLRRLEIKVERPNAEDLHDDTARVLAKLISEGAKSQTLELIKAPKIPTLLPSEDTKTLARVAETNGYVKANGKNEEGELVKESTKSHPKVVSIDLGGGTYIARFLASLKLF